MNKKSLGIDVGSSSVKVSLMDIATGECIASATNPSTEMPIDAVQSGWAEQDPEMWWKYVCEGIQQIGRSHPMSEVACIGITYQMHGLVVVDREGKPLRKSIIWCDSRAVEIGREATERIGAEFCRENLLNQVGNFTASKLAWVKQNEPEIYAKIDKVMLPGDYIAMKLSGETSTTDTGLSEGVLWDFKRDQISKEVTECYGFDQRLFCEAGIAVGTRGNTSVATEQMLGIPQGTPLSYRAGDQPNNAFSLNVLDAGEVAATGGTSGVIYGVIDEAKGDKLSRVNTFLHVNHTAQTPRYGVLLCINGTGIANAWVRRNVCPDLSYVQMNELAEGVEAGSDGVSLLPFGNGAERMLGNRMTGTQISGLDLNRHTRANIVRATQEGIAFSFRYGLDIMREMGLKPEVIRAGEANMFLSPLFMQALATICDVRSELFNTDGALGAARGAALGAGFYDSREEAFQSLRRVESITPNDSDKAELERAYSKWVEELERAL